MAEAEKHFCLECKECAKDLDGNYRCKHTQSWCYQTNTVILETNPACELFHLSWWKDFKKPELTMKIKGE